MEQERYILHCDCNSFYASVELLAHPELRAVPVAVCGDPSTRHGIILAKNDPAKKFGVQTAQTIWQAKQRCPELVLLPASRGKYSKYSAQINQIYAQYTDRVEPFGIDESWLDITHTWHLFAPTPLVLANEIRHQVKAQTGLTISVGVSFNKVFAKLGSDYKKPDATTVFSAADYQQKVWPLPVGDLLYVGKAAREQLSGLGIGTIGDLAAAPDELIHNHMGKMGAELLRYARGQDNAPVRFVGEKDPLKSVGNGMTFRHNLVSEAEIATSLAVLADEVASRLRHHGVWAGGVQVSIRDANFKTITRQKKLTVSTHLGKAIAEQAMQLVKANWQKGVPIRMLTITAQHITEEPFAVQQSWLDEVADPDPKREKLEQSLDAIRQKYGKRAIGAASIVKNDLGLGGLAVQTDAEEPNEYDEMVKGPL